MLHLRKKRFSNINRQNHNGVYSANITWRYYAALTRQLTQDGKLTEREQISSRQVGYNSNNTTTNNTALGTAIIGDGGVPLSNNANLQNISIDSRMRNRNTKSRSGFKNVLY